MLALPMDLPAKAPQESDVTVGAGGVELSLPPQAAKLTVAAAQDQAKLLGVIHLPRKFEWAVDAKVEPEQRTHRVPP
jgi:hypothetical protein